MAPMTDGNGDLDRAETREWLDSLEAVLEREGADRARFLLTELGDKALRRGVKVPFTANTPYINTIPPDQQPPFPGSREIERRIKSPFASNLVLDEVCSTLPCFSCEIALW